MTTRAGASLIVLRAFRTATGSGPRGRGRRAFVDLRTVRAEGAVAGRAVVGGLTLALVTAALLAATPIRADELTGTVTDAGGAPVGNADFDVFDLDGNKLPASDNTDATGRYQLVLAPGRYDVLVQPLIGSGVAPKMIRSVSVAGTTTLDWVLPPAFRQLGRVRAATGRPVLGTRIEFDVLPGGERVPSLGNTSSAFGTFAAHVAHGTYTVTATPPESTGLAPARLTPWTMPGADTLTFVLPDAAILSGRVRDGAGAAVGGVRLSFDREGDDVRVPAAENRTAADGTYRTRVAPGRYQVLVVPPTGGRLAAKRVSGVDLTSSTALDVTLDAGLQVGGVVHDSLGHPLVGADWDVTDRNTGLGVPTPGDNTDADGRFALVLPPGLYRLTLTPPPGSGLPVRQIDDVRVTRDTTVDYSYAGGGPIPPAVALALKPLGNPTYQTARIRLALPEAADVTVELFDASGRRVRVLASGPRAAGVHDLAWDGRRESGAEAHTGVYFVRAIAGERRGTTRFVLLPRTPVY